MPLNEYNPLLLENIKIRFAPNQSEAKEILTHRRSSRDFHEKKLFQEESHEKEEKKSLKTERNELP